MYDIDELQPNVPRSKGDRDLFGHNLILIASVASLRIYKVVQIEEIPTQNNTYEFFNCVLKLHTNCVRAAERKQETEEAAGSCIAIVTCKESCMYVAA